MIHKLQEKKNKVVLEEKIHKLQKKNKSLVKEKKGNHSPLEFEIWNFFEKIV
jgi:hypothetical protein